MVIVIATLTGCVTPLYQSSDHSLKITNKETDKLMVEIRNDFEAKVHRGMKREEAPVLFGIPPSHINTLEGSWGRQEQWEYGFGEGSVVYLYFQNGVLDTWQTSWR